jgi:hypothetical protein
MEAADRDILLKLYNALEILRKKILARLIIFHQIKYIRPD